MNLAPERNLNQNQPITCLVAGGAGFNGAYLVQQLLDQNCFVICLDNFSTGRRENLKKYQAYPNFYLLKHDLTSNLPINLDRKIDYIFHLTNIEAYLNGLNIDLQTLLNNSFGTETLLKLAVQNKAKFLLGSTEDIYHPFHPGDQFNDYFGATRQEEGRQAITPFTRPAR